MCLAWWICDGTPVETYNDAIKYPQPKDLIPVAKSYKELGNLSKNSTLLIGQMKVISPKRVLKRRFEYTDSSGTLHNEVKSIKLIRMRDAINEKIARFYGSGYLHKIQNEISTLNTCITDQDAKINTLLQEVSDLTEKNNDLEEKILKLESEKDELLKALTP